MMTNRNLYGFLYRAEDGIRHLLSPRRCLICRQYADGLSAETPLCAECRHVFLEELNRRCSVCGKTAMLCRCAPWDGRENGGMNLYRLTEYPDTAIRRCILHVKDAPNGDITDFFARNCARLCELAVMEAGLPRERFMLVALPRTAKKKKLAGTDQTAALADVVSYYTGLPVWHGLLHGGSRIQKALSREERIQNAAESYALNEKETDRIAGCAVILLDDICTTGASLCTCAALLRGAGAAYIAAVTIAKTHHMHNL